MPQTMPQRTGSDVWHLKLLPFDQDVTTLAALRTLRRWDGEVNFDYTGGMNRGWLSPICGCDRGFNGLCDPLSPYDLPKIDTRNRD